MKIKVLLSIVLLIFSNNILAQSFMSTWQYSWGGNRQDMLNVMIPLPGNKYFFAGTATSEISCTKSSLPYGDEDFAVVVFDGAGNKLWEKSYGGDRWDQLKSAIKVPGGFLLAGETQSGASGIKTSAISGLMDFWVVRIDDNGNLLWEKSYGETGLESAVKIVATPDGGFLIAGFSLSNPTGYGGNDYKLIKIDASGNLIWSKLFGGTFNDELHDLVATTDGNFFLSGTSTSPVSGNKTSLPLGQEDIWLVKIDPSGTKLWDRSYGTSSYDIRGRLLPLQDGNYIIVESTLNTGRIRKIDGNGNQIWLQTCSGNNQDVFEVATEDVSTGNIYVAGISKTNNVGCKTSPWAGGGWFGDIWIAVFDQNGNKINDLDYGGNDADIPMDIKVLDNEIWITGWSDSPLSGNKTTNNCGQTADGWIIRLSNNFSIKSNTPTAICQTQQNSKVHFRTGTNFNAGNSFTVQLSDINGSFSSPQNIGSKLSIHSDSIVVNLPPNTPAGSSYKIRVIASSPADTTASYPFWILGSPQLNLGNDTTLCTGTTIILNTGQQAPASQYLWQDNSTGNFLSVNSAGLYWCEIQNSCGTVRDSILVSSSQKPFFNIGNDSSICKGSGILVQSSAQSAEFSYLWNTGSSSPSITVSTGGVYWLAISNICGSVTDSMTATLFPSPSINLNKDSIICNGNALVLAAASGFANYQWSTGESTPSISVDATGLYWVKIQDVNSCVQSDTTIVTKIIEPPRDFIPKSDSICSFENLTISPSAAFTSYEWSNGMNSNSIKINEPGTYWLTVTDKYSCKGTDTIVVNLKKCLEGFYIPNAFTPNQDGLNDVFKPIIGGNLKTFRFSIYDRWGKIVFITTDPKNGWDGRYKGTPFNSGVFIWTCEFEFAGSSSILKKGTAILLR